MPTKTRFVDLLGSYEKEIHRYAFRMTGDAEDAADVLQDTFLKAFKAFARLPDDANHRAWLYRIAHREALNLFRSQKVRETEPLDTALGVNDANGHPDDLAETRRLVGELRQVIRGLTLRQRSALLLKKYEGLPYAEVAQILGCSEDNARAQVYQAMKKIRNGLRRS
jgi:RNA polymerase sigma-70 factor (ECF subfamily)